MRVACVVVGASACAPDPEVPTGRGEPCERDAECNASDAGECGVLRLCIMGYCERPADGGVSRVLICDHGVSSRR